MLDLLDAVALLRHDGMRVRLLISGRASRGMVDRRVQEMDLAEAVELLGGVDYGQAPEIYRRAAIFVSPTYAAEFPPPSWRRWPHA